MAIPEFPGPVVVPEPGPDPVPEPIPGPAIVPEPGPAPVPEPTPDPVPEPEPPGPGGSAIAAFVPPRYPIRACDALESR
jgi:hypothetical protein